MTNYNFENLEAAIETSIYDDGISQRQRRALRGKTPSQRRAEAYAAQSQSGVRIRIARQVMNEMDFREELKIWYPHVQEGMAKRKSLGNLTMTLFDTAQQPLRNSNGDVRESVEHRLEQQCSSVFEETPPIGVQGIRLFGNMSRPFIGLTLALGFAQREHKLVRGVVAPELLLGDDHQLDHRLHISLGQAHSEERAHDIVTALTPVLPEYVKFKPATVSVECA